jgi:hypothetical protein
MVAGAINLCFFQVGVRFLGDTRTCFDEVFGMFQHHICLDRCHFGWDAMTKDDDGGEVDNDSVIARVSIVAEFEMCKPGEVTILGLQDFKSDRIKKGLAWMGSIVPFNNKVFGGAWMIFW